MKEIKISKSNLLVKVKENRDKHIAEYKEAMEGYKLEIIEKLKEGIEKLQGNLEEIEIGEHLDPESVYVELSKPQTHEKDYNQVIAMLEMSVENELIISYDEFKKYALDDWKWSEHTKMINASYLSKKMI